MVQSTDVNRRQFLATCSAGISLVVAGCQGLIGRNGDSDQPESTSTDEGDEDTTNGLRIIGVYADDVERKFLNGEYVLMKNTGTDSLDISGYVVEYPMGYSHQIADLALESGAQFALKSQDGENSVFQMAPPLYLRYVGADTAPLLGKSGTLRVRNAEDDVAAAITYDNFGCDNGAESGKEMVCPHPTNSES